MSTTALTITDPGFVKKDKHNALDTFFLKLIKDERDLPFIHLSLRLLLITIPIGLISFIPGVFIWWIFVPLQLLNLALNMGPFVLMLHNTSHRNLFKKEYNWMNRIIPWFIGPFFGETPETYYGHHVLMHHPENNLKDDLSCTMQYQRDNIFHFLHYFGRFFFIGIYELAYYFQRKKRPAFIKNILIGEFTFYGLCILLSLFNWQATLVVFVMPFIAVRFGMMAGNWGQHAFIDVTDPGNSYKNSITCVNAHYNKICFNDGYHIGHHVRPAMHWTKMPEEFQKNKDRYIEQGAIIFQKLDFFIIWFHLMTHNYKVLAKNFVDIGERYNSDEEIITFLKKRTTRIPDDVIERMDQEYLLKLRKQKL